MKIVRWSGRLTVLSQIVLLRQLGLSHVLSVQKSLQKFEPYVLSALLKHRPFGSQVSGVVEFSEQHMDSTPSIAIHGW